MAINQKVKKVRCIHVPEELLLSIYLDDKLTVGKVYEVHHENNHHPTPYYVLTGDDGGEWGVPMNLFVLASQLTVRRVVRASMV